MELSSFIKLLVRHKFTLIIIPLVTVIITYFLVRNQPDTYTSNAQLATGLVDQTQQSLSIAGEVLQDSRISQEFSNLIAMIKSKKMLDQVSYQLMIHDLTSATPFRKPSKLMEQLNSNAKKHAVEVYTSYYNKRQSLSLFNSDQKGLYELIKSMKYDDESVLQKLLIYRADNSDFIDLQYDSENPNLSALLINDLCKEFIQYYTLLVKDNQHKAVTFYGDLMKAKEDSLNVRMNRLKTYKIQNRVLNLNEQARALYGQIADFETRAEEAQKNTISTLAAIRDIDKQFDPADRKYVESSMIKLSQQVLNTRFQLQRLNSEYVQSSFNPAIKRQLDSLNSVLTGQIYQNSDTYTVNPLSSKQHLIEQKLALQIQYDLSQNSVKSIQNELNRLNVRLNTLVPHEAVVQADENAINVAHDEYIDALNKYNQSQLQSNFSVQLRQIEMAMPGTAQPSKKMLLVIISGIISFVFCIVVLFILFYLDNSVKTPNELANTTKIPVLGYLHKLKGSSLDLRQIWTGAQTDQDTQLFKNLLQSIRYEVDHDLHENKVLLINSLTAAEGKTFLALNLAYAYALINKNVLLIDGNFNAPGITEAVKAKYFLEDYLSGKLSAENLVAASKVSVLGNKGGDISLLQLDTEHNITNAFNALKAQFDIIIIEASALSTLNKSKEWIDFTDKIVTVFKAGQTIKGTRKQQVNYLKSLDAHFSGWVLNEVDKNQLPAS
ncbi:lipopolysaccharide biosynthesis protein [Mucilaginibacter robiniae]|uniref:Lipopolysaccharide biosynthesis protein n=1 Tax=Mucilaginibacter robiniae TaxID=2728022 RepID=A0A7L5DTY4_9SPHI|nr:Wzz/FepE/Etk N-terminal domain-containing protein [Mucilaginibacter robiniae]QJD94560.1 lipopolysaccharide biosynthesis protein [Mucilaginibacter robiniae]